MGQNLVFGDGHAKFRPYTKITSGDDWQDCWHATEGVIPREY